MKRRYMTYAAVFAGFLAFAYLIWPRTTSDEAQPSEPANLVGPSFDSVGPRLVSNQTSYPLYIYGNDLPERAVLVIDAEPEVRLSTHRFTQTVHTAELPADAFSSMDANDHRTRFTVRLMDDAGVQIPGESHIDVVNDRAYPIPYDFAVEADGSSAWIVSPTTDELLVLDDSGVRHRIQTADRPRAIERWTHDDQTRFVVLHEYTDELWVFDPSEPEASPQILPAPNMAQGLAIHANVAAVTSRLDDSVWLIDLPSGMMLSSTSVAVDPRAVAFTTPETLAVAHIGSSDLVMVSNDDVTPVDIGPGALIRGGLTSKYSEYVMGGKLLRDLHHDVAHDVLYASSIGPNIGPNPDQMEVSMNGGISVFRVEEGVRVFSHHASMHRGTPEGILYVPERDMLFAADIAMGRVMAFDGPSLRDPDEAAKALRAALEISPPEGIPILRPASDYGVNGRPGTEIHSGTRALARGEDPDRLFALNRFTGTISVIAIESASEAKMNLIETWGPIELGPQMQRRSGETLFFTDLGNSRMTCDTCHYEGHNEGVLFTKGEPTHIYRSPTIRNISETAPYFTPAKFPRVETTSKIVLSRNRFHNPDANPGEVRVLSEYQKTLVMPPNPYVDGSRVPEEITLRDGASGNPERGARIFAEHCASCHTPPMYTTDQDEATRGRFHDVGTAVSMSLRDDMQEIDPYDLPVPSLVGVWDNFPLLHSGDAGFSVVGEKAVANEPFALRAVLDMASQSGKHGEVQALSEAQKNDLLAFMLTL